MFIFGSAVCLRLICIVVVGLGAPLNRFLDGAPYNFFFKEPHVALFVNCCVLSLFETFAMFRDMSQRQKRLKTIKSHGRAILKRNKNYVNRYCFSITFCYCYFLL